MQVLLHKKGQKILWMPAPLIYQDPTPFPNPHWKIAEHEREVHSDKVNNGNVEHKHDREEIYPGEAPSEMVDDPDFNGQVDRKRRGVWQEIGWRDAIRKTQAI